jgi:hypothetical protein
MKKNRFFYGLLFPLSFGILLFASCERDKDRLSDEVITLAETEAINNAIFEEIDGSVESIMATLDLNEYSASSVKSTYADACPVVTVDHPDTTYFPKIVAIDYGDGCSMVFNNDTITRKGKIIISVTNRYFVNGAKRVITFEDFYINDVKVEGTRTITNLGLNENGHFTFGIKLENGKITFNDGKFVTCQSERVREWARLSDWSKDTLYITGWVNGTNINGDNYTCEIDEPLVLIHCLVFNRRWTIVDGSLVITIGNESPIVIDYGDGTCDRTMEISKDRKSRSVEFHYRHHWRY